jgi:hypothetical protein
MKKEQTFEAVFLYKHIYEPRMITRLKVSMVSPVLMVETDDQLEVDIKALLLPTFPVYLSISARVFE